MPKITLIGAGSVVFTRNLCSDILLTPALQDSTITLMDIDAGRLAQARDLVQALIDGRRLDARVEATTDRREAVRGADYVDHDLPAGRPGRLRARHRDSAALRRRAVRRRYAWPGRRLPRAAHHPGADRALPRDGRAGAGRAAAQLRQPDGGELLGRRSGHRAAARRAVPQRAGHQRDAGRVDRRALRRGGVPLRRHQPPGVLPELPARRRRSVSRAAGRRSSGRRSMARSRCGSS